LDNPLDRGALVDLCDQLLVRGGGRREIEVDPADALAEREAREIATREAGVRARKRQLRETEDDDYEDSTSEQEGERAQRLRDLEREIERLGDSVRAPDVDTMDVTDQCRPEPDGFALSETPSDARKKVMWHPTFAERALRVEEKRCNFVRVYPGQLDQHHAVIRALLIAAGPKPSLGLRANADLARSSLMMLTRSMEDDLFRSPAGRERPCRRDCQCEMYKAHGVTARECLDAETLTEFERSGRLPVERQTCLGCKRFDVTWYWMFLRWHGDDTGASFISSHYNLVNMRGEYLGDQCLLDATRGLPLHVVAFNAGAFAPREQTVNDNRVTVFVQTLAVLDNESDFA
jgi:hypothetical protein